MPHPSLQRHYHATAACAGPERQGPAPAGGLRRRPLHPQPRLLLPPQQRCVPPRVMCACVCVCASLFVCVCMCQGRRPFTFHLRRRALSSNASIRPSVPTPAELPTASPVAGMLNCLLFPKDPADHNVLGQHARFLVVNDPRHALQTEYLQRTMPYFFRPKRDEKCVRVLLSSVHHTPFLCQWCMSNLSLAKKHGNHACDHQPTLQDGRRPVRGVPRRGLRAGAPPHPWCVSIACASSCAFLFLCTCSLLPVCMTMPLRPQPETSA